MEVGAGWVDQREERERGCGRKYGERQLKVRASCSVVVDQHIKDYTGFCLFVVCRRVCV